MSQSSQRIGTFMAVFKRPVTGYELRTVGGFTPKQIERAVKDAIIVKREDGEYEAATKQPATQEDNDGRP